MNIVYFGTPEYACIPLTALLKAGHNVNLAVTQPDKPKGRGNKTQKSPVRARAEESGIRVIAPDKIKNDTEVFSEIASAAPDFIVVYSYGQIIPRNILDIPKYGCINIHASLLPKYRGAAPIQRSVLDGEKETGVTLMLMDEGLDTGDIYISAATPIDRKTSAELFAELSEIGAKLLVDSLPKIADGSLKAVPQLGESSYAGMLYKNEGEIDWTKSAVEVDRLVRAFNDAPVAWTLRNGEVIKIYETEIADAAPGSVPGSVISADKRGIVTACGSGAVMIKRLQAPGKKIMDAASYLLGNRVDPGSILG